MFNDLTNALHTRLNKLMSHIEKVKGCNMDDKGFKYDSQINIKKE